LANRFFNVDKRIKVNSSLELREKIPPLPYSGNFKKSRLKHARNNDPTPSILDAIILDLSEFA